MISINKCFVLAVIASVLLSAAFVQADESEEPTTEKPRTIGGLGTKIFNGIRTAGSAIMSHIKPFLNHGEGAEEAAPASEGEAATEASGEEASAETEEASAEEPATEAAAEEPATEAAAEEPSTEAAAEEPTTEAAAESTTAKSD